MRLIPNQAFVPRPTLAESNPRPVSSVPSAFAEDQEPWKRLQGVDFGQGARGLPPTPPTLNDVIRGTMWDLATRRSQSIDQARAERLQAERPGGTG